MSPSEASNIVLTGCGWVSPLAAGKIDDIFAAGRRAGQKPPLSSGYRAVSEELLDGYPSLPREIQRDKGAWMTAIALLHACEDAGLPHDFAQPERVGLILGCGLAGQSGMISFADEVRKQSARFVSPIHFPQTVGNYISGAMARGFKIRGPNVTLASGAASGLDAIVDGCAVLAAREVDLVFAGGVETLTEDLAAGMAQPGVRLSEGACLFALERAESAEARGARPLGTVLACRRSAVDDASAVGSNQGLLSCASAGRTGAVFIGHWIGQCGGAAGAAAVAAVIGAADGANVPILTTGAHDSAVMQPVAVESRTAPDGSLTAVVHAEADRAHATMVELSILSRT